MSSGLGRRFAALGGGEVLARLAAFAVTIYLARTLGPALYGIVGVATGVMLYLTQIADAGVELIGVPLVARTRTGELAPVASAVLSFRVLFGGVLAVIAALVGITLLPDPDGAIIACFALSLFAAAFSTRWIHIGLERTGWVAISRTAGELLTLVLVLTLVRVPGDVVVVPLAQFVGAMLASGMLLTVLRRQGISLTFSLDWTLARNVFTRSRHLVSFTLLGLLLFNFDLIYLRIVSGAAAAGFYAAAYTMISFAANLIVAFAHTVMPALTRLDESPRERDALLQTSTVQAFALALPVAAGAYLVADQIIAQIFGRDFLNGVVALKWLAWSIPLAALRELPVVGLIAAGREAQLLRINAITAACNVVMVIALVPLYSLEGAAAATLATEAIRLAIAWRYARLAGYSPPRPARLWKPLAGVAMMAVAIAIIDPGSLFLSVPLGAAVYGALLLLLGAIRVQNGFRVHFAL